MLHLSTILKHYKRRDIQEAMVLAAEDKEVAVKYGDKGFGKRPDVLEYPADVLEFAKKGATSFHVSEERWKNVMQISTGMRRQELEELRKGWDLVLDIDCTIWYYSKYIAHLVVEELKRHGIRSITAKFSGNKGFHIAVPLEAFPKQVNGEPIEKLFPDGVRRVAMYIAEQIKPKLIAHVKERDGFASIASQLGIQEGSLHKTICSACKKDAKVVRGKIEFLCKYCGNREDGTEKDRYKLCSKDKKIMERLELAAVKKCMYCKNTSFTDILDIDPLLQIDTVLISSRHLYRMPYSLHEKSGLCSVPVDPFSILQFDKKTALPANVVVGKSFLGIDAVEEGEGTRLILEAYDYQPLVEDAEQKKRIERTFTKFREEVLEEAIPVEFFPPCITLGMAGMKDGKKRFMFALVNFLASVGYDYDTIEKMLVEWNEKNPEALREVLVRGHIRYSKQHKKKVLPPNCDNKGYFPDMGLCKPDGLCQRIKNPAQYAKRKAFFANLDQQKGRQKLTDEQKAMRKAYRDKKKAESEDHD